MTPYPVFFELVQRHAGAQEKARGVSSVARAPRAGGVVRGPGAPHTVLLRSGCAVQGDTAGEANVRFGVDRGGPQT